MSDAEMREKVIDGLKHCVKNDCGEDCPYKDAEWIDRGFAACRAFAEGNVEVPERMLYDALVILKAQEPRVMKVGDVRSWVNSDRTAREPIIIEMRNGVCAWIVDDEVRELKGAEDLTSELYGKTWRCWTSRPSDTQREATPWQ